MLLFSYIGIHGGFLLILILLTKKKWFMKLLGCYKSLGAYERAKRPKFQGPNKKRLKRRIK